VPNRESDPQLPIRIDYDDLNLVAPFRVEDGDLVDNTGALVAGEKATVFLRDLLNNAARHHGVFMAGVTAERMRTVRLLEVLISARTG
jgi:hypothetical protein